MVEPSLGRTKNLGVPEDLNKKTLGQPFSSFRSSEVGSRSHSINEI